MVKDILALGMTFQVHRQHTPYTALLILKREMVGCPASGRYSRITLLQRAKKSIRKEWIEWYVAGNACSRRVRAGIPALPIDLIDPGTSLNRVAVG